MNFKDMVKFHEQAKTDMDTMEYVSIVDEIGEFMNNKADDGKSIILNRMKEEDFVKFLQAAKATLLTSMVTEGRGGLLLMAEASGDLAVYTTIIIMSVLGVLAEEEVI